MQNTTTFPIRINKVEKSKIDQIDFDNLSFGNVFTDHMLSCDYKDGKWQTPVIEPYGPLVMSPAARVLHYGQAIFEGMKAYKDANDEVWLFRPEENFLRFNKSSKRLAIPELPREVFFEGLLTLLRMDKEWVRKGAGNTLYIRPFVFATQAGVSAAPANEYKFMILMSPAQAYYTEPVKVLIAEKYSRAANGGVGAAKAAGNYGAQFYPTSLAKEQGYQQIVWTDSTHEYLEEAGTMNVFFRIGDKLITAPTSDRILDGVTRKSLLDLAKEDGIPTEVRKISVKELIEAANNNSLKEIFGAGTAAIVSTVSGFGYQDKHYDLPEVDEDSYALRLKKHLTDIQYNQAPDPFGWRYKV